MSFSAPAPRRDCRFMTTTTDDSIVTKEPRDDFDATEDDERDVREPREYRDWIWIALAPLALVTLCELASVGKGPHVSETSWADVVIAPLMFLLLFFVPMFLAGIRFEQSRDARSRRRGVTDEG